MAAIIFHNPVFGTDVESGDQMYFYAVGTTTQYSNIYTDFALTAAATQPVVADSDGRFVPLYIDAAGTADFKVVLKDSSDAEKFTCERYPIEDITTLTADMATAQADITTNAGSITTLESEMDTAQSDIVSHDTRLDDLEGADSSGVTLNADFTGTNQSLTTNGFQDLPGGLRFIWGETSVGGDSVATVTFSAAQGNGFDTGIFPVQLTIQGDAGSAGDDYLQVRSPTASGFDIYNPASGTATVGYFCVGY